jgi:tetratricopeptide (TPR) repeat protein
MIIIVLLTYNIIDGANKKMIQSIEKSIAVIPVDIDDLSYDESQHFAFIGEQITSCLVKVKDFRVVPYEDHRNYKRGDKQSPEIGYDLSAAILVDLSPYETRAQKNLFVNLIIASDGSLLLSESFKIDGSWSEEVCKYSRKISKKISRTLRIYLTREERASIDEQNVSAQASLLAFFGRNMTQDAIELVQLGDGDNNEKSEYIDSISFEKAIQYFTEAIKDDPTLAEAYANRAKASLWGMREGYFDHSILDDCMKDITKAFELDPNLPEAHIAMGFYQYFGNDEYLVAAVSFEIAVELKPDNPEYLYYLSLIWRRLGNWDRVQTLTDKVFESNPGNAVFQTNLGLSYLYLQNFSRSVECQDRAIDLIPKWTPPHLNKINALMWEGKTGEARKAVREAERITGKQFYRIVALLDLYEGQYDNAVKNIEKATDIDFSNNGESQGDVFLLKAEIYRQAGSVNLANEYYIKSVDYFRNLVLFETDNYWAFSQLGVACAGAGMVQQAIGYGQQALDLIALVDDAITYPEIHYNMIRIYAIAKQNESALRMIKEHLNLHSPFTLDFLRLDPDIGHLLDDPGSQIY